MTYKEFDDQYRQSCPLLVGIDEVGRGPLAGPVVVTALILDPKFDNPLIKDSKLLSAKRREELYPQILANCLAVSTIAIDATTIDKINILEATKLGMVKALESLGVVYDLVLVDGVDLKIDKCRQVIGGDHSSLSVAAASIVAKVERDRMMAEYDLLYPGYHFARNSGYGTREHLAALEAQGPCPIHRRSFAPVASVLGWRVLTGNG